MFLMSLNMLNMVIEGYRSLLISSYQKKTSFDVHLIVVHGLEVKLPFSPNYNTTQLLGNG